MQRRDPRTRCPQQRLLPAGSATVIRRHNLLRGLTQAELAGSEFTKGFISLLETGRTRASMRAAGILAARLGVSTTELISADGNVPGLELQLLRGEQLLASGQAQEAIALLQPLVTRGDGPVRAKALRIQGRALVDTGQARAALEILERVARSPTPISTSREMC